MPTHTKGCRIGRWRIPPIALSEMTFIRHATFLASSSSRRIEAAVSKTRMTCGRSFGVVILIQRASPSPADGRVMGPDGMTEVDLVDRNEHVLGGSDEGVDGVGFLDHWASGEVRASTVRCADLACWAFEGSAGLGGSALVAIGRPPASVGAAA